MFVAAAWTRRALSSGGFSSGLFGLSSEQIQLVDSCLDFAQHEFKPYAAEWDENKIFPRSALRKAAELGLGGMFVPEELGGAGFSRHDGSLVFESLSQGCTSTTAYLSIHNMCAWMISQFATNEAKHEYLPKLISMDHFASYCLTEPSSGSDAASLKTTAVKQPDGSFVVNGSKAFISGGGAAQVYVVMVRTDVADKSPKGISCVLVDSESNGVSFGAQERKLGWNSQPTCVVNFDNVSVRPSNLVGNLGQGFKIAMQGLDGGRLSIGACSLGAAQASLNVALDHVQHRHQFGQPLCANQTIQFKLADMQTKLHLARMAIRNAAKLLDDKHPAATAHCSMAKKVATEFGYEVVDDSLQLLGGYGYLKDHPVERYLRDARVHRILEGTNEIQSLIMARDILK
ncbi:hypothetical protein BASA81_000621 [Batrachochytrium salamandrivorans]|nr:hypothetical protein BASA81_000621 [Batrachochytrium salamandrivorans]